MNRRPAPLQDGGSAPAFQIKADRQADLGYRGAFFRARKTKITNTMTAKIPATTRISVTLSIGVPQRFRRS